MAPLRELQAPVLHQGSFDVRRHALADDSPPDLDLLQGGRSSQAHEDHRCHCVQLPGCAQVLEHDYQQAGHTKLLGGHGE